MKFQQYHPNKDFLKIYGNRYYKITDKNKDYRSEFDSGDCVVRALTKALDMDYLDVAKEVASDNKKDIKKILNGNKIPYEWLKELGFYYFYNSKSKKSKYFSNKIGRKNSYKSDFLFTSTSNTKMEHIYNEFLDSMINDFIDEFGKKDNLTIIWNFSRSHVATSIDDILYDSWDSRNKGINGFWVR